MIIKLERVNVQTTQSQQLINISDQVQKAITDNKVKNGLVTITSMHTTAAITVNEGAECVQSDIIDFLVALAPKDGKYRHARHIDPWGGSAANAETHLRELVTGIGVSLAIENGKIVKGGLQNIYLVEFDGPCYRTAIVQIIGE